MDHIRLILKASHIDLNNGQSMVLSAELIEKVHLQRIEQSKVQ
jgi:hypothetical protein